MSYRALSTFLSLPPSSQGKGVSWQAALWLRACVVGWRQTLSPLRGQQGTAGSCVLALQHKMGMRIPACAGGVSKSLPRPLSITTDDPGTLSLAFSRGEGA